MTTVQSDDAAARDPWLSLGKFKPYAASQYTTNLYMVTAVLTRFGRNGRRLIVKIDWTTFSQEFGIAVTPISDMSFNDGEKVEVILSTETGPGCMNGHPMIEAVEVASGVWARNTL